MPNDHKVTFNQQGLYRPQSRNSRLSWPMRTVIKMGLAQDQKQAALVLLAVAVPSVVIMVVAWPHSHYEVVPQPGVVGGASYR